MKIKYETEYEIKFKFKHKISVIFYNGIIWPWYLLDNTIGIHFLVYCWIIIGGEWEKQFELTEQKGDK